MKRDSILLCLVLGFAITGPARSQEADVARVLIREGASVEVYKQTTDVDGKAVELKMFIFSPADHQPTDSRPAVVFFFGGGWKSGTPAQFAPQCKYLAQRGMVAMTADYRVLSRQGTKPTACVRDGKSAVRWIRENADRLGVDPERIAAGGGSAGGHVAACTGLLKTLDEPSEDLSVSSQPNALILFNPALVLAPVDENKEVSQRIESKLDSLRKRIGTNPETISPAHHIADGEPATIIFHGKSDRTVPYNTAEVFADRMKRAGNSCELVGYAEQGHGFFNANRKNGKYKQTLEKMDQFLVAQGFLAADNQSNSTR